MVKVLSLRERQHGWAGVLPQPQISPLINRALRQLSEYPVELVNCRNCGAPKRLKNDACPYCGVAYPKRNG